MLQMSSVLQFSIFLLSSFIEDFLFILFQQKNEKKQNKQTNKPGNTLMEFKYLLSRIDLFDVKDFKWNLTDVIWSANVFKSTSTDI